MFATARKKLARRMNLKQIIIGGRIPGYGEHADEMSATEYVERVMAKELRTSLGPGTPAIMKWIGL